MDVLKGSRREAPQREKNGSQPTLRWLWQVTGRYKAVVGGLTLLDVVLGASSVGYALLFGNLVDRAAAGQLTPFLWAAGALGAMTLVQMGLNTLDSLLSEWARASMENRLKERLFGCLLHRDYAAVTARHSGDWVARLTSDTAVVAGNLVDLLPRLAGLLARLSGALAALFLLQPAFFYILVPAGCAVLLLTVSLRRILKRMHKQIQEAGAAFLAFVQERLESMMIVRVFSMEDQTCAEAAARMERHKAARLRRNRFSNLFNFGFWGLAEGGYLLAALYCGYGILRGTVSYGTFTAILQLVGQVQSPVAGITGVVPQYYAMIASAERLMEAETYPGDGGARLPAAEISRYYREEFVCLGVRGASFSYKVFGGENRSDGKLAVISRLNIEVKKGEYVAFTGHSGCGKSTLLKLLMCLYPLDAGELYLRGVNGETPLTPAWRGLFAYVPQGNQLMSGTIREIVAFGDPGAMAQEERLARALDIACAGEFVSRLENGMDTRLGERGCGLSEGQMQRIAIARAVFSDRPVLILDESTSALDEYTERRLLSNLRRMTDKTVLIITHRPAALAICDRQIDMAAAELQETT